MSSELSHSVTRTRFGVQSAHGIKERLNNRWMSRGPATHFPFPFFPIEGLMRSKSKALTRGQFGGQCARQKGENRSAGHGWFCTYMGTIISTLEA